MKKVLAFILAIVAVMSFMIIPVSAEEEKKVSDIWVIQMPDKTEYYKGETLDLTGLVMGVAYTDGSYETVDSGFEANLTTFTRKGNIPVTVTYMGEPEVLTFHVDYNILQKAASIVGLIASFFYMTFINIINWF